MAEILPEDSGVIRCICAYNHDDNFTIQCERCNAWQHATCVNIKDEDAVPEHYMCPECNSTLDQVDRVRAKEHQRKFLQHQTDLRKHTRFQVGEDSQEERKRRGNRKRHLALEPAANPAEDPVPEFEYKYFVIPTTELEWTNKALSVWERLRSTSKLRQISSREVNSMPQLTIYRARSSDSRIGVNAGAISPTIDLGANKPVCELFGELMLRTEYCDEPTNQFARLGCPKLGVVFVPGLPFAVDMRRRGSPDALFLSRSSTPNVRLVAGKDTQNNLRVFVYTRKPVKAGTELSLGWHWPANHPIRLAISADGDRSEDKKRLNEVVETALWLLDRDLDSCAPYDRSEDDEDWEVAEIPSPPTPPPIPPPRRKTRAEEIQTETLLKTEDKEEHEDDPGVAMAMHVWVPAASQGLEPPPKKRLSLKDYMRKRA